MAKRKKTRRYNSPDYKVRKFDNGGFIREDGSEETEDQYWERIRNTPQSQLTTREYASLYGYEPQSMEKKDGLGAMITMDTPIKAMKKHGGMVNKSKGSRDMFSEQYD